MLAPDVFVNKGLAHKELGTELAAPLVFFNLRDLVLNPLIYLFLNLRS